MGCCVISGTTICIERISPEVIILRPPEKLIIEVRVSGEYEVLFWFKGTSSFIPGLMRPQEFPNYHEAFIRDNTTAEDEGLYIVQPQLKSGTSQTHTITPTEGVNFGVIAPGAIDIVINQLMYAFLISQSMPLRHLSVPLLL